jgi:hypothetical protein
MALQTKELGGGTSLYLLLVVVTFKAQVFH